MKKYELTEETKVFSDRTLHRIRAVRDFKDVKAEYTGGWIEKEENLSHEGNAWVYGSAIVYGNARVSGDAEVCGNARVSGDARVRGDARVSGDATVCGNAEVYGNAKISAVRHILTVGPIGSRDGYVSFYRNTDNGISVSCGCFAGTLEEFAQAVNKKHAGTVYEQEYLQAISLAKQCICLQKN